MFPPWFRQPQKSGSGSRVSTSKPDTVGSGYLGTGSLQVTGLDRASEPAAVPPPHSASPASAGAAGPASRVLNLGRTRLPGPGGAALARHRVPRRVPAADRAVGQGTGGGGCPRAEEEAAKWSPLPLRCCWPDPEPHRPPGFASPPKDLSARCDKIVEQRMKEEI